MPLLFWTVAVVLSSWLIFREKTLPRWLSTLWLIPLSAVTLFFALFSSVIPFRFVVGRPLIMIPLRLMMPAFAWALCWAGALCAFLAGVLALLIYRKRGRLGLAGALSVFLAIVNTASSVLATQYILRVVAAPDNFAAAFGPQWQSTIPLSSTQSMLQHRWSAFPFRDPDPRVERDVAFATIPGTNRKLLADFWLPPQGVATSGVTLIFFHGSAWHFFDKGIGMDPTFRHLAAQGHVVMDVSYRLAPEADLVGMVGDVQRSVVMMKANASRYGVDPRHIVIGGASAGAQIAMLAAYSATEAAFTPPDLVGADTSVRGVVSYYGPADMRVYVNHEIGKFSRTGVAVTKAAIIGDPNSHMPNGPMSLEQMMFNVMGGMPQDVPQAYDLASVRAHVTSSAPPTLIFQGAFDCVIQTSAVRDLASALRSAHVPVVYVEFPETDHGFDVATSLNPAGRGGYLPVESQLSPPSEAALYDLDRFLALMRQ
jgi:acetyl esterase/lipase